MRVSRRKQNLRDGRGRQSPARKVQAHLKWRNPKKVTEALDALYATEDSTLDPVIERLAAMALAPEDW
jgi:hypothetical protein